MADYGLEACVQIAYDTQLDSWEVIVPEQTVTSVSVDYDPQEAITRTAIEENLIIVADIHSHHRMPAFYSGTDDADECGVRLYGVFGNMRGNSYDILFRAGAGGHFARVPAAYILENYEDRMEQNIEKLSAPAAPIEWIAKVSPRKR